MYTKHALREIGIDGDELSSSQRVALDRSGFFVVEGVYGAAECRKMADEFG